LVNQIDRADDVGVDDVLGFQEVLIEKGLTEPVAGVGEQRIDVAPAKGHIQVIDAVDGRQIDLHSIDLGTERRKLRGGSIQGAIGGHDEIETVGRALARELEADTARRSSDDSEWTWKRGAHDTAPWCFHSENRYAARPPLSSGSACACRT